MSESSSEPETKPARPLNRWGIGSLSVIQVLLLAAIVLALNYLAVHHFRRIDLSRTGDYTLSSATRRYLADDALAAREKPIKWVMAFRRSSPFYERVRALAEEYGRHSNGKIELEIVDPLRSPDRMQEITAAYGLSLLRDMIIIDARSDDSAVATEDANKVKSLNPHVKLALADEFGMFSMVDQRRKITAFQGEDVLTARLVEAIEGKPRRMALLADKSRLDSDGETSPRKSLEDTLRFQNIELADLQLAGLAEIPGDFSGIVLAAPAYDLTDSELAVLEDYWNRPRAAMLVMIEAGQAPPKLRAFLRANGITPRRDRIVSRNPNNSLVASATGTFLKGIDFTRDLAGQTTEFGGASSSLDVREGDDDLLNRRIYPMDLIEVSAPFWGESKFGEGNVAFTEEEDHAAPLSLAACVIRGAEGDDRFAADSSRMVVIANTDFISPQHQSAENLDFLASSANWLVGRESLAGIGPRPLWPYKLPLLDAQVSFINRVNLFFLPAFLLLTGLFVWSSRRA